MWMATKVPKIMFLNSYRLEFIGSNVSKGETIVCTNLCNHIGRLRRDERMHDFDCKGQIYWFMGWHILLGRKSQQEGTSHDHVLFRWDVFSDPPVNRR